MYLNFIELEKGKYNLIAPHTVKIGSKDPLCKNIPVTAVPRECFDKEGVILVDKFLDGWTGCATYTFDRDAYNKALKTNSIKDYKRCFIKHDSPHKNSELAHANRRAEIRDAIRANVSVESEVKMLREAIFKLFDETKITPTDSMIRFAAMLDKIKSHYPKENERYLLSDQEYASVLGPEKSPIV